MSSDVTDTHTSPVDEAKIAAVRRYGIYGATRVGEKRERGEEEEQEFPSPGHPIRATPPRPLFTPTPPGSVEKKPLTPGSYAYLTPARAPHPTSRLAVALSPETRLKQA